MLWRIFTSNLVVGFRSKNSGARRSARAFFGYGRRTSPQLRRRRPESKLKNEFTSGFDIACGATGEIEFYIRKMLINFNTLEGAPVERLRTLDVLCAMFIIANVAPGE